MKIMAKQTFYSQIVRYLKRLNQGNIMSKTQTLDQAWHLIDFQANLFNWGLGIITLIFGVAVLIQWGLNHKNYQN